MELLEYFKEIYNIIKNDWNVEKSLEYFGEGKSNEEDGEFKVIRRYYIEPNNKSFSRIFLNFDDNRNINSIVWFFNENCSLNLYQLKELFGAYKIHNVIYDETTDFVFFPQKNRYVNRVKASVYEWVEKRTNGTLYIKKGDEEFDVDDEYKVQYISFLIEELN